MDHVESIKYGLNCKQPPHEIVRKVYLTYPTKALIGSEEKQYEILNSISTFFEIPIISIHVVGSAKVGKSLHQNTDFIPGKSDLDVAIIDALLYVKYMELSFKISNGYSDKTKFPIQNGGQSTFEQYVYWLSKGIFRPNLMPFGPERAEWTSFFGKLSDKHSDLFGRISAGIYLSQTFFEYKQRSAIEGYRKYISGKTIL
ncbi:MAG: hypothetical protein JXA04_09630 [Gammaproteobacteria bacterium]|nr:hypothetical protein [Gammaproteobacteria bacterium]